MAVYTPFHLVLPSEEFKAIQYYLHTNLSHTKTIVMKNQKNIIGAICLMACFILISPSMAQTTDSTQTSTNSTDKESWESWEKNMENWAEEMEKAAEEWESEFEAEFDGDCDSNSKCCKGDLHTPEGLKLGVDMGIAGLQYASPWSTEFTRNNDLRNIDIGRSRSFSINAFMNFKCTNWLYVVTGAQIRWNRYAFSNNVNLMQNGSFTTDTVVDYQKYVLKTTYVQVPVLLKLSSKNNKWAFAVGPYGGIRIGSKVKSKHTYEGKQQKNKVRDDFNLTGITYGLQSRITYNHIGVFAQVGMNEFMNNNNTSNMYPYTVGITIGGL